MFITFQHIIIFLAILSLYNQDYVICQHITKQIIESGSYIEGQICVIKKSDYSFEVMEEVFNQYGATVVRNTESIGLSLIQVTKGNDIFEIIESLQREPSVEFAEPNYIFSASFNPNDPHFSTGKQWGLNNIGQIPPGGTTDADIDAPEAWDISFGSGNIKIAVLDTGIPLENGELSHEDLNNSYRIEIGPDLVYGVFGLIDPDPTIKDLRGHGTHVTGIVGAETNNSIGIAGLAPNCKILSIQIGDVNLTTTNEVMANGIVAACSLSANVINISYSTLFPPYVVETAIREIALPSNVLVIASVGNDNGEVLYPARYSSVGNVYPYSNGYPNVIAVGATNQFDERSSYSNFGFALNVVAPGGFGGTFDEDDIFSTLPNYPVPNMPLNYGYASGTSMAAPIVAGISALILSVNPNLTPLQIRNIIQQSAEDKGSPGRDDYYGWGRVNAYKAVKYTLEQYGGTITGVLSIPYSEIWNFNQGITLRFENNSKLIVQGTINANGIVNQKITFDFASPSNGNGIILSPDAVINISNAIIKNAHYGIMIDRSEPTIQDCEFQSCINGLFLNESNYEITLYEGTRIANNKFSNNSVGINLNNSSPLISGNEFTGNSTSIQCLNGSNAYLGEYLEPGVNSFHDNLAADVYASYSSPTLGLDLGGGDYIGGYNNFENVQEYFVIAENSNIEAGLNWWGESPPNENYFYTDNGYIELRPWLENSPNAPQQNFNNSVRSFPKFSASSPLTLTVFDPTWNIRKKINFAEKLIRQNEKVNARKILKDIVLENPDSTLSFKAVNLFINSCRMNSERDTLKKFLKLASNIQNQKEIHRYVKLRLLELNRESYLSNIDGLISTNQNSEILELIYFSKFMHNYFNEKNYNAARVVMNKMVEKFPLSEMTKTVKQMMGETLGKNVGGKTATALLPQKSMLVNYPNPFNPTTKIKFSVPTSPLTPLLKERGRGEVVTLRVFDILGNEVATLVNEDKQPGVYEVEFSGSNLPSGIYFYQLRVGQFVETRKMILLR